MIRFGDLINNRSVVYLNNRPIGIADLVNGEYQCFDARTKTTVESLSVALKFFKKEI